MRIIHLSYNIPNPNYTDPKKWLERISFSTGVMEAMTAYSEVIGIYHINYKGTLNKKNVLYHFTGYKKWQVLLPWGFNKFIKKLKPDVIIVHGLIFPWQVVMLRFQLGKQITIIAQHHAERPLRDIRQYLQRLADRYIKAYLFSSHDLGQKWIDKSQIRTREKVFEIMGTSSPFKYTERQKARSITQVTGDVVYLWVGRLDENKDPVTVLMAFRNLLNSQMNVTLYMIYQTYDLLEKVNKLMEENSDKKNSIVLVGRMENNQLENWYNSADFIISSSHYEGSGIAVCEAMSCGCIPILTDIPSFRMMTNNGDLGLLYKPGSVDELTAALDKSLALNEDSEIKKVIKKFNSDLSFEANAKKIHEVIKAVSA